MAVSKLGPRAARVGMQVARDGGSQGTAVGGTPRGRLGASRCSFYALPGPLLSRAHKSTLGFSRSIFLSGCQFTTQTGHRLLITDRLVTLGKRTIDFLRAYWHFWLIANGQKFYKINQN